MLEVDGDLCGSFSYAYLTAAGYTVGVERFSAMSTTDFIPVAGPWITKREVDYAADAAKTAWNKDHYAYNAKFERALASYVGVDFAVSLPHCTSAIHLSLAAMGIGPGDEVIAPDVTWIASVAPIIYVGAEPVFADIDPTTWCVDPDSVEACITPKTKAIIGVDLYGSMADWPRLRSLADKHGLYLIEDAAEAIGSQLDGAAAGSFGDTGVFSFHGSKTVVTGEGGMLATNSEDIYARVMKLRDHGRPPGDRFFLNDEVAFKYKMSALQAAIGLAQMERIDELIARKKEIYRWYAERLKDFDSVRINAESKGVSNSFWMVTVIMDPAHGLNKFDLMAHLREDNIDSRPFFSQLSTIPAFADRPEARRFLPPEPAGSAMAEYGVNLPSGYDTTEEHVERVVASLKRAIL